MINLLPPDLAQGIKLGRRNAHFRRWLFGLLLATLGLLLIVAAGWLYLDSQASMLSRESEAIRNELEAQNLTKVQAEADQITSQIKLINQVLVREVKFSELIQEIGKVMPPGTVLSGLNLENNISGGVDLTANTRDYQAAARVAANLSDPANKLFSTVDIVTVNCATSENAYKCNAEFRALFAPDAKERFLNVAEGNGQ